jgi:aspartate/methionine/tyrosine aminotransferase
MVNRVRLAGAVPRFATLVVRDGEWRLDLDALAAAATTPTKVVFINNASFPSGWVASAAEWDAISNLCRERDLWLLYWGGFELTLFDGLAMIHPASLPDMRDRTVIVGSAAVDYGMIAWRIGWVVSPTPELTADVSRVQIYNGLTPSSFAQVGVKAALDGGDGQVLHAVAEYERRRDETLRQLEGLPVVKPAGAWSLLLDVASLGLDPGEVSHRLLQHKVAATSMVGWGSDVAALHVRFVFSNEPVERLALLGERVHAALS